ncbi:hypothetical protein ACOME3_000780 [Neoechinorhynchus agilis]
MDPFFEVAILSVSMFIGSYISGLVPLMCSSVKDCYMKWLVAFGAGMLLSSATTILIPEALMNNVKWSHDNSSGQNLDTAHVSGSFVTIGFLLITHGRDRVSHNFNKYDQNGHWLSTFGLCLHAGCDGIAVGAAALSSKITFKLTIFLAMAIHKAPVAFGLCSILRERGLNCKQIIRKHLLIFSLTSPIFALFTYGVLGMSGWTSTSSVDNGGSTVGKLLMLSAGTFLYISTIHILPEIFLHEHDRLIENGERKECGKVAAMIVGCAVPMVTAALVPHSE